jgi:hypothetical protein
MKRDKVSFSFLPGGFRKREEEGTPENVHATSNG